MSYAEIITALATANRLANLLSDLVQKGQEGITATDQKLLQQRIAEVQALNDRTHVRLQEKLAKAAKE